MLLCSEHRTNIDTLQVLCSSTSRVAQSLNMLTSRFSCINQFMDHTDVGQMKPICRLIEKDLSEPYSIFTYRYFIYNWPKLCVMVNSHRRKCDIFNLCRTFEIIVFLATGVRWGRYDRSHCLQSWRAQRVRHQRRLTYIDSVLLDKNSSAKCWHTTCAQQQNTSRIYRHASRWQTISASRHRYPQHVDFTVLMSRWFGHGCGCHTGSKLAAKAIQNMKDMGCDEVKPESTALEIWW